MYAQQSVVCSLMSYSMSYSLFLSVTERKNIKREKVSLLACLNRVSFSVVLLIKLALCLLLAL